MNTARLAAIVALLLNLIATASIDAMARPKVTPASIHFQPQFFRGLTVTNASAPKNLVVSNPRKASAISALIIQMTGSDTDDFGIVSNGCGSGLRAGSDCSVGVIFTPTRLGARAAKILISDGSAFLGSINLSGSGVRPKKLIQPASLSFGKVDVGQTSPPQTVTLKNPNSMAVTLNSIATTGPFIQTNVSCGPTLGPGKSCQLMVSFVPTTACNTNGTVETGALNVVNNATATPQKTILSGTAINQGAETALFVASGNLVSVFPIPLSSSNPRPIGAISNGLPFGQAIGVALDSAGDIYVAVRAETVPSSDRIEIYSACANVNSTPVAVISSASLSGGSISGIALDSGGKIYVVSNYFPGGSPSNYYSRVLVFPSLGGNTGELNESPLATISGATTGLTGGAAGVVVDANGMVYVASNSLPSNILIYPPIGGTTGNLNEAPIAKIGGKNTALDYPVAIAVDSSSKIYVTDSSSGNVLIYPPLARSTGNLDETPLATMSIGGLSLQGIALDSAANIYVGTVSAVSVYPPIGTSTGVINEPPTVTITSTALDTPSGIALDSSGDVYVANVNSVIDFQPIGTSRGTINEKPIGNIVSYATQAIGGITVDATGNIYETTGSNITVFAAGSEVGAVPIAVISGCHTGIVEPKGLAVDMTGDIFLANYSGSQNGGCGPFFFGSIVVYQRASNGNATPVATIGGTSGIFYPVDVTLDATGGIYVLNNGFANEGEDGIGSIGIYPAHSNGDTAPTALIKGSSTGLNLPSGIALDSSGRVYVANGAENGYNAGPGSITVYPPLGSSSGMLNESPVATIAGENTQLSNPASIALDPASNIYVANSSGTIAVYPPLKNSTGILNEPPVTTLGAAGTLIAIGPFLP